MYGLGIGFLQAIDVRGDRGGYIVVPGTGFEGTTFHTWCFVERFPIPMKRISPTELNVGIDVLFEQGEKEG